MRTEADASTWLGHGIFSPDTDSIPSPYIWFLRAGTEPLHRFPGIPSLLRTDEDARE
jgi:hypothetical protein